MAPEVGAKGLSVLARSPVGWDEAGTPGVGVEIRDSRPAVDCSRLDKTSSELFDSKASEDLKDEGIPSNS